MKSSQAEVCLDNVDTIVAEISQNLSKNGVQKIKETSTGNNSMVISHLDHQTEFVKYTPLNASLYNSVIEGTQDQIISNPINYLQSYNKSNNSHNQQSDLNSYGSSSLTECHPERIIKSGIIDTLPQRRSSTAIRQDKNYLDYFSKSYPKVNNSVLVESNSKDTRPYEDSTKLRKSPGSSLQTPNKVSSSRSRSPNYFDFKNPINIQDEGSRSARPHYTQGKLNVQDNHSPVPYAQYNQTNPNPNPNPKHDFYKSLSTYNPLETSSSSSINARSKISSSKNNCIKFIRSPQKTVLALKNPPNNQRKLSSYKEKSEKLKILLQKLHSNEFIESIELVSEDLNDQECEELAIEIGKYPQGIDSIKLVKNRIGDVGLKAILDGLQKSSQRIHTLNFTSNLCTENCFEDILKYLKCNTNLKNIYLLNNQIQSGRNKEILENIQQICNIHL